VNKKRTAATKKKKKKKFAINIPAVKWQKGKF
jgi:hypothetical protein